MGGRYHLYSHGAWFLYLATIVDWHSRYVLAWLRSNTLDADFCVDALEEALSKGAPEIFNTDQGSQFTGAAFTGLLKERDIRVSQDGRGVSGQHLRRAALAEREVRGGVPEGVQSGSGGSDGHWCLPGVLQ